MVHAVLLVVFGVVAGTSGLGRDVRLPDGWPVVIGVLAVLVIGGVVLWSPLGRRKVVRPAARTAKDLLGVLRRPNRAFMLFGGSAAQTLSSALSLAAGLTAFRAGAPVVTMVAVYPGGNAVASVAPTPGNLGALEAALVAGLTATGVPTGPAVAGVLTYRLLTFWLPILPCFAVFRLLRNREMI